jgi:hypothetical protein
MRSFKLLGLISYFWGAKCKGHFCEVCEVRTRTMRIVCTLYAGAPGVTMNVHTHFVSCHSNFVALRRITPKERPWATQVLGGQK